MPHEALAQSNARQLYHSLSWAFGSWGKVSIEQTWGTIKKPPIAANSLKKTYLLLDWVQVGLSSLWGQTSFFFWAPSTCILLGPGRLASGPFIPTLSTTESLSGIIRANLKACWWEWRYILEMKDMVEMCIFCNIWDVLFDILSKKCKRQNHERPDHKHLFLEIWNLDVILIDR